MPARNGTTQADDVLPTVVDLARTIAGEGKPDTRTMAIAHATHARLTAERLRTAPPCWSCRHHTVFCWSVPVLHCMHPAIAEIERNVSEGRTIVSSKTCSIEREDGKRSSHGTVLLCGASGLLHEPLVQAWVLRRTRALVRKWMAER